MICKDCKVDIGGGPYVASWTADTEPTYSCWDCALLERIRTYGQDGIVRTPLYMDAALRTYKRKYIKRTLSSRDSTQREVDVVRDYGRDLAKNLVAEETAFRGKQPEPPPGPDVYAALDRIRGEPPRAEFGPQSISVGTDLYDIERVFCGFWVRRHQFSNPLPWPSLDNLTELGVSIQGWSPERARWEWLDRFEKLTGRVVANKGPRPEPRKAADIALDMAAGAHRKDLARLQDRVGTALGISVSWTATEDHITETILQAIGELKVPAKLSSSPALPDGVRAEIAALTSDMQSARNDVAALRRKRDQAEADLKGASTALERIEEALHPGAHDERDIWDRAASIADATIRRIEIANVVRDVAERWARLPDDDRCLLEQAPNLVREVLSEMHRARAGQRVGAVVAMTSDADRATIADLTSRLDELRRVVGVNRG